MAARVPFMAAAGLALVVAGLVGLVRMGWVLPALSPALVARHGPLMVSAFLGTLISLERAVGLGKSWAYVAPAFGAAGSVMLLAGLPDLVAAAVFSAAATTLVAAFGAIYRIRPNRPNAVLALAAAMWLGGNVAWGAGVAMPLVVVWWSAFLVLTIAGERLELARIRTRAALAELAFFAASGAVALGPVISLATAPAGIAVTGAGLAGLGAWLVRYDIAWRTVRLPGLSRYIAWCLLPGYFWLIAGGVAWVLGPGVWGGGVYYDAMLHAVFLGFVMSMIFGHAPVIVPALLGVPVPYSRRLYAPLVLLHASLVSRIAGDLLLWMPLRLWSGIANVVAVLGFLAVLALTARTAGRLSSQK
ncbi:hypothetical protein U7230_03665 [Carboxydochorda subterranea]|uniref:NnrS family protein n=1 Tax=Carboxydichorda subterranea TaxID=3109565 RepID=A0ABZ1BZE6_9FIRM|nr:hypothetical protein [Limnochorda sp. L945t]WRP18113.1 hypothetical protein U7230_03665 [Limnochorda sp. L945t]